MQRFAAPLGALAGVAAAFTYVGLVDPNEGGHYPACPLLRFTGIYCPGCGGLRCVHALTHGDLPAALSSNALAVLAFAGLAGYWVFWVVRAARGRSAALRIAGRHQWAIGAVALAFTVVRNLPLGAALAP